jgi:hypothetical protein
MTGRGRAPAPRIESHLLIPRFAVLYSNLFFLFQPGFAKIGMTGRGCLPQEPILLVTGITGMSRARGLRFPATLLSNRSWSLAPSVKVVRP